MKPVRDRIGPIVRRLIEHEKRIEKIEEGYKRTSKSIDESMRRLNATIRALDRYRRRAALTGRGC